MGLRACPPAPQTVMSNRSAAAIIGPGRVATVPIATTANCGGVNLGAGKSLEQPITIIAWRRPVPLRQVEDQVDGPLNRRVWPGTSRTKHMAVWPSYRNCGDALMMLACGAPDVS